MHTDVSRALSPKAGFITSCRRRALPALLGGRTTGSSASQSWPVSSRPTTGIVIHVPWLWWLCIVVGAPTVAFPAASRHLNISTWTVVVLGAAQMAIVLASAFNSASVNPVRAAFRWASSISVQVRAVPFRAGGRAVGAGAYGLAGRCVAGRGNPVFPGGRCQGR